MDYPLGHCRRRAEGIPLLLKKFQAAIGGHFSEKRAAAIEAACSDQATLETMAVNEFMDLWYL